MFIFRLQNTSKWEFLFLITSEESVQICSVQSLFSPRENLSILKFWDHFLHFHKKNVPPDIKMRSESAHSNRQLVDSNSFVLHLLRRLTPSEEEILSSYTLYIFIIHCCGHIYCTHFLFYALCFGSNYFCSECWGWQCSCISRFFIYIANLLFSLIQCSPSAYRGGKPHHLHHKD